MPSHHLLALLLRIHHTVAPKAMQVGPISHHWTGLQGEIVIVAMILLAAVTGLVALTRPRRSS